VVHFFKRGFSRSVLSSIFYDRAKLGKFLSADRLNPLDWVLCTFATRLKTRFFIAKLFGFVSSETAQVVVYQRLGDSRVLRNDASFANRVRWVCRKTLLGVIVRLEDKWNHKGTKNTKKKTYPFTGQK